jgi:RNA polymerase sigma-70 factor (ECF subfamily)
MDIPKVYLNSGRKLQRVSSNSTVVTLNGHEIDAEMKNAEILDACRRGDREALRALYETYKDRVYSVSLYFFHGDAAAASDVTQQVFLKLITQIAKFRGDSDFSTWLHRLVVNVCVDGMRRDKTRARVASSAARETAANTASHEGDMARAEVADSIQAALSSLPPKFRMPVLLRYFEDLSYEEVASALNCSMGTVASRLSRAHKLLAQKLAPLRG